MENHQFIAPKLHYRVHHLKQRTRPLWPANENVPGAAEVPATVAAMPAAAPQPARVGFVERALDAIGHGLRVWHAHRMIHRLESWPDHRLDAIGIARGEIESTVRRLFGLQPGNTGSRDRA